MLYILLSYINILLLYHLSRYFILLSFIKDCKCPNMGEKKVFSTRVDDDLIKKLKHLAVDEDESLGSLLDEAIEDLLKKYEKDQRKKEHR